MQRVSDEIAEQIREADKHRFSVRFLEAIQRLGEGCCLPGQYVIDSTMMPIMVINIPRIELEYFGIRHGPFDLDHNWRYLTTADDDALIQINIYLKQGRILVCNLAPEFPLVRRFIREIDRLKHFGFFFYNKTERLIISSFCRIDSEEQTWINRNIDKLGKVKNNNVSRIMAASMLHHKKQGQEAKFYLCGNESEDICFAGIEQQSIPFQRIKEYL